PPALVGSSLWRRLADKMPLCGGIMDQIGCSRLEVRGWMANKEPSQANPRLSLHIAQERSFDSLRSLKTRILIGCCVRGSIKLTPGTEPGESAPAVTTGKGRRERSKPCMGLVSVADLVNHNRHWGTPPPGVLWKDIILLGLARTASQGCDFIGV